ncbi:MAG: hypothetical protein IPK97_03785 [Ahniella sp.]|nr:hypothetical protein [Ahniella sp.]
MSDEFRQPDTAPHCVAPEGPIVSKSCVKAQNSYSGLGVSACMIHVPGQRNRLPERVIR